MAIRKAIIKVGKGWSRAPAPDCLSDTTDIDRDDPAADTIDLWGVLMYILPVAKRGC